jgi:hypothetical protein
MEPTGRSKELLLAGLVATAMGAAIILFASGIVPVKNANAPPWIGTIAGLLFVIVGGALLLRWSAGGSANDGDMPAQAPLWSRAVYYAAGLACVAALATIGSWVAFGPGERVFSASIPLLENPWIGRAIFGTGAILSWMFFLAAASDGWRKLRAPISQA